MSTVIEQRVLDFDVRIKLDRECLVLAVAMLMSDEEDTSIEHYRADHAQNVTREDVEVHLKDLTASFGESVKMQLREWAENKWRGIDRRLIIEVADRRVCQLFPEFGVRDPQTLRSVRTALSSICTSFDPSVVPLDGHTWTASARVEHYAGDELAWVQLVVEHSQAASQKDLDQQEPYLPVALERYSITEVTDKALYALATACILKAVKEIENSL